MLEMDEKQAEGGGINIEKFRELAILLDRKRSLDRAADGLNEKIQKLQAILLPVMQENQLGRLTVVIGTTEDGRPIKKTVFPRRTLWAGHQGDVPALNEALEKEGLGDYVKKSPNMNSLSAYVRGFDPDNKLDPDDVIKKLPEALQKVIKVSEKVELRSTSTR